MEHVEYHCIKIFMEDNFVNHTYVYRKHLREPLRYIMLILISIILEVALLMFGLSITDVHKSNGNELILTIIILLVVMCLFVGLEMFVIYHLYLKRFKSISVTLSDEALIYTNYKGQLMIPYKDIEQLKFPTIKYTGGWMKIIYRGGNIRLTVVMENIDSFISELKEKLKENEMSHVYNEKKMLSFFKTAVFSDISWDRIYCNFKVQLFSNCLCIILTTAILRLYYISDISKFFLFGSIVAPLLGYLVSDIIIGIKVRKGVDIEKLIILPRNSRLEQKIFYISFIGFSVGYLFFVFVMVFIFKKLI